MYGCIELAWSYGLRGHVLAGAVRVFSLFFLLLVSAPKFANASFVGFATIYTGHLRIRVGREPWRAGHIHDL